MKPGDMIHTHAEYEAVPYGTVLRGYRFTWTRMMGGYVNPQGLHCSVNEMAGKARFIISVPGYDPQIMDALQSAIDALNAAAKAHRKAAKAYRKAAEAYRKTATKHRVTVDRRVSLGVPCERGTCSCGGATGWYSATSGLVDRWRRDHEDR